MNFLAQYNSIIIIILLLAIVGLAFAFFSLKTKLDKFLMGKAENLDDTLAHMKLSIVDLEKSKDSIEKYLRTVEVRLRKSIQAVSTVRFNPFKGTGSGSNQSFSTVFLNEEKDGVVISSLYSREHISVYSKPIKGGVSEYELSDEEKQSIKEAEKLV